MPADITHLVFKGVGTGLMFGIPIYIRPVLNRPDGCKIRFRFRCNGFGVAFVKERNCISKWIIEETDEGWNLRYCQARNDRRVA